MEFAENLRQIRKDRQLSQEDLAELLDVSRQAVSKWEQGVGYPEVEKLLLLSDKLHIALDTLMGTDFSAARHAVDTKAADSIVITAPYENVIAACYKVFSSQKMHGGKEAPKYALIGVSKGGSAFWGEPTSFLGWYANRDDIAKEISEIRTAISNGAASYELKFSVKTERHWLRVKMIHD